MSSRPPISARSSRRGQGATEYLVILAVVLIVAMVAIALLGYFPGMAGDSQRSQSDTYWQGSARPFAILNAQQPSTGNFTVVVQNVDHTMLVLTNISVAGGPVNGSYVPNSAERIFNPGETHILIVPLSASGSAVSVANPACLASGSGYSYFINFTYTTQEGITGQKEFGSKPYSGKCT
jgi:hypothetical protein